MRMDSEIPVNANIKATAKQYNEGECILPNKETM